MGLDLSTQYPVEGNPSWGGVFGSNAYFAVEQNGVTYIFDITGEVIVTYP